MHMLSKSDLTPEEQETVRKCEEPTVLLTANGTARSTEETTVNVIALDMFIVAPFVDESVNRTRSHVTFSHVSLHS